MASSASTVCSRVCKAVLTATLLTLATAATAQTPLLPSAVAYDASGNLYFADTNRNQVFELPLSGTLTLVAGTGTQGFSGDNALPTTAELNAPQGLAISSDGTLYIADTGNQRIRAIRNGILTTTAGTGIPGYSGDNAPAINAQLNTPTALAIGPDGTLYVADTGNQRIRSISPQGILTTIAGTGTQGFSGDGTAATAAELNSPSGLAIAADGTILIADTHNQRIRSISPQGILTTIAGTGLSGYSGDNGPATAVQLCQPRGLAIAANGTILIADSGNQRLRSVSPQGILTTIAGTGTQGLSHDGVPATAASLNNPGSIAISPTGVIAFTDTSNSLVRTIANGELFTLAPASATRLSSVQLSIPTSAIYGQGTATVTVQSNASQPQGTVTLLDGATPLATATLTGGSASVSLTALTTGLHSLTATYTSDGLNPAATSAAFTINVTPAPITATATTAAISYGQPIPALTGTTTGILPRDTSLVAIAFTTSATALSPAGNYPILATITGPAAGNYAMSSGSTSGSLQIQQAPSDVTMQPVAAQSYVGLPLLLAASVASKTSGTPTGEIDFEDGNTVIAKAICVNGIASSTYASPPTGLHSLTAVYLGDTNFLGSASPAIATSIAAMPDFSIASSSPTQTVQRGLIATYPLTLSPQGGAFTGSVTFSVSGLPAGATASFSPSTIVPGATGVSVAMSVQTAALARIVYTPITIFWVLCLPLGLDALRRRKRVSTLCFLAFSFLLMSATGCGARTVSDGTAITSQPVSLIVTATSTNLLGAIVSHSTVVTLSIQ